MDSSPGLSALLKTPEPSIFNIAIKDEPVEILDSPEPDDFSYNDVFKNYLEGINAPSQNATFEDSGTVTKNKTQSIPAKTSSVSNTPIKNVSSPATEQTPTTKKIMINGQAKTCVVVDIPELKQNIKKKVNAVVPNTSASKTSAPVISRINQDKDSALVKCSRCLNQIFLDDFRQHIDNCLPRKPYLKKLKEMKTTKDFEATKHFQETETQAKQMETVQVMYNPFTGEIVKGKSNLNSPASNGSSSLPKTVRSENIVKINKKEAKLTLPKSYSGFYGTYDETEMIQRKPKIQLKLNCNDCNFKSISIIDMKDHIKKTHSDGNSLVENTPGVKEAAKDSPKTSNRQQFSVTASKEVCPVATPSPDRPQDKAQSNSKERIANLQSSDIDDGSDKSLESSASNDSLPAFRGFDRSASQTYISNKLCNLNDIVRSKFQCLLDPPNTESPTTKAVENTGVDKTTTDGCINDNNQSEKTADEDSEVAQITSTEKVVVSPRRTRSKSVCAKSFRDNEKDDELDEGPRRSMRLRSKSVCARKAESDAMEWSPIKTRSRSVCKDRFVSEQGTRDFKRAQSVPRGSASSENRKSRGRGRDKKGNNFKQTQDVENAEKKGTFRIRSKSVAAPKNDTMHPITYYQTLLKTRSKSVDRSKFLSDLVSLKNNDNLDNSTKSADVGRNSNKVSSREGSLLGISKSKSVSDISRLNDFTDSMEVESENSYDDLFLLADSTFSCTICSYTTDKQRILKDHERYHRKTNLPIFRCVYCNQRYTKYMLYSHVQNVHPGQKFQICEKEPNGVPVVPPQPPTSKVNEETRKSRTNTPSSKVAVDNDKKMSLNCSRCEFSTTHLDKMTLHVNNHDLEDQSRGSETVETTKNHPSAFPAGCESLKCTMCSFQTSTQDELTSHLRDHDFEPIIGTPGLPKFSCKYCSFSVDELQKLRSHFNNHKENMAIQKCSTCDFRSTRHALRGHLSRCVNSPVRRPENRSVNKQYVINSGDGSIPKYECRSCSYKTANSSKMKKHVTLHRRNEKILECTGCDFKSTKHALMYHMSICKGRLVIAEPKKLNTQKEKLPVEEIRVKNSRAPGHQCNLCSYWGRQARNLNNHLKLHERGRPLLKCDFCAFRSTKRAVSAHQLTCQKTKRAKDNNDSREKRKGPITLKVKPKSIFRCVHCKYFTTLRLKLNLHVKKHHLNRKEIGQMKVKAHSCSRCSFTTNSQKKLKLHGIKCGGDFKCNLCSFSSAKEANLTKHMNSHKKNIPVKKCPCCDFASVPRILTKHQQKYDHTILKSETTKKTTGKNEDSSKKDHFCSRCSFTTDSQEKLMLHSAECGADFKCSLCSFSSAFESYLSMHMNSHKKQVPVKKCPCCDFASVRRILAKHQRKYNHTQDPIRKAIDKKYDSSVKVHFCSRCSFTTDSQEKLMLHSVECDSNFKCTLCSFSCAQEFYLRQHMASHKNNIPNKNCPHCDFVSSPGIVQKHVRKLHRSGSDSRKIKERKTLFQCSQCSFSTTLRIKLNIHAKKYHQSLKTNQFTLFGQNYQCNLCSYSSTIRCRILRHADSHKTLKGHVIQCKKCDYRSTPMALRVHAIKCHAKENGRVQSNKVDVKNTDKVSQSEVLVVPSSIRFTCPNCSYSSARKAYLQKHKRLHKNRNLIMEQCASCTFRSTPKVVKTHFYSCTGRENPDPLNTDPPILQRASPFSELEGASPVIESKPSNVLTSEKPLTFETSPPILERMPPVLERADLVLNKENSFGLGTATSSMDSSPPVLERVTLPTSENGLLAGERTSSMLQKACPTSNDPAVIPTLRQRRLNVEDTASANVTSDSVLKNFKCQYCSFESVLAYLLERHMVFHTVLKLPVSQCDKCDFRSTPATLSAHQKTCSENLRDKSSNSRQKDKCLTKELVNGGDMERNQPKKNYLASRRKSVSSSELIQWNSEDSSSANKRKVNKTDDICDNSLGRTPRKSRRLEEKFYTDNSIREMFVDVVSCIQFERSRSSIRTKKCADSPANKVNEDHSSEPSKVLVLEDNSEAKNPKIDYTQNIPELSDKVESNGIRKKAFSCPKCNYSSSLRVKLRFHLKRCH